MPLNIACTTEEKVKVTASPISKSGKAAKIDGALRVSVKSGSGTFTQDPAEPLSFYAVSGDDSGDTQYDIEADADLGAGVTLIADMATLTVSSATAESFGLSSSAPEAK